MRNCIFTSHCIESFCDKSCPIFAEVSYLLERNNLINNKLVSKISKRDIDTMTNILKKSENNTSTVIVPQGRSSIEYSDFLTYCAICQYWKGNQLHVNVFNLKYSAYLDKLKKSWSNNSEDEDLQYLEIWSRSSKVLIISGFDYVDFKDFESQTLLTILQDRKTNNLTTILVSPPINSLISTKQSVFFGALKRMLKETVKVVSV